MWFFDILLDKIIAVNINNYQSCTGVAHKEKKGCEIHRFYECLFINTLCFMSVVYIVCYRQRSVKVRFAETVEKRRCPALQRTVGTNGFLRSRRSGRNRFGFGKRHPGGRSDNRNRLLRLKNNVSYTILWSIQKSLVSAYDIIGSACRKTFN